VKVDDTEHPVCASSCPEGCVLDGVELCDGCLAVGVPDGSSIMNYGRNLELIGGGYCLVALLEGR